MVKVIFNYVPREFSITRCFCSENVSDTIKISLFHHKHVWYCVRCMEACNRCSPPNISFTSPMVLVFGCKISNLLQPFHIRHACTSAYTYIRSYNTHCICSYQYFANILHAAIYLLFTLVSQSIFSEQQGKPEQA